jgi:hypothetical protein
MSAWEEESVCSAEFLFFFFCWGVGFYDKRRGEPGKKYESIIKGTKKDRSIYFLCWISNQHLYIAVYVQWENNNNVSLENIQRHVL